MINMSTKQLIDLQLSVGEKEFKYTGRFLGFIKDDEFNALIQNADQVASKLESSISQPLMDIISKFDNIVGHRLVMTVKKLDGQNVKNKTLLITDGLQIIDSVTPRKDKAGEDSVMGMVTFTSNKDETISVQEAE
jgi:hypothetical protein